MRVFGDKKNFAIEYEVYTFVEAEFKVYVNNKSICTYIKNDIIYEFKWDIRDIVDWLRINLYHILNENEFPLPVDGNTAIELFKKSGEFDSDDEEFDSWHEKRQEWVFRHSWYSSRSGGYFPDIYFRKVGDEIEISWDNRNLYNNVEFLNPIGSHNVELKLFKSIIESFINAFNLDTSKFNDL